VPIVPEAVTAITPPKHEGLQSQQKLQDLLANFLIQANNFSKRASGSDSESNKQVLATNLEIVTTAKAPQHTSATMVIQTTRSTANTAKTPVSVAMAKSTSAMDGKGQSTVDDFSEETTSPGSSEELALSEEEEEDAIWKPKNPRRRRLGRGRQHRRRRVNRRQYKKRRPNRNKLVFRRRQYRRGISSTAGEPADEGTIRKGKPRLSCPRCAYEGVVTEGYEGKDGSEEVTTTEYGFVEATERRVQPDDIVWKTPESVEPLTYILESQEAEAA
jgi:hypothetical protein